MPARNAWLIAAFIAASVGVIEAATILRMIPAVTVIDVGALLVTGFLAGLFAGLHLVHRRADRHGMA